MSTLSVWKGAAHPRRGLHRSQPTLRRTEGFRSVRLCPAIKDRAQWRGYGEPAVGNKKRAGNERRLIRGPEKRCIRHILRLAQATQLEGLDPRPYNVICDHRLRSEEHTSELQSLMRISNDVFCLKKKNERE